MNANDAVSLVASAGKVEQLPGSRLNTGELVESAVQTDNSEFSAHGSTFRLIGGKPFLVLLFSFLMRRVANDAACFSFQN